MDVLWGFMIWAGEQCCMLVPNDLKDQVLWRLLKVSLCSQKTLDVSCSQNSQMGIFDCVRNLFISIYFSHFELFLPMDTHPLTHVLTFAMLSPHVSSLLSYFAFTIHTKSEPLRIPAMLIQASTENRSYLLVRLFARHLLPPNTVSQGFTDRQPQRPLFHKLVMRLYILRN